MAKHMYIMYIMVGLNSFNYVNKNKPIVLLNLNWFYSS